LPELNLLNYLLGIKLMDIQQCAIVTLFTEKTAGKNDNNLYPESGEEDRDAGNHPALATNNPAALCRLDARLWW
jgi:hypothetical protein